jgi:hypothetical protein
MAILFNATMTPAINDVSVTSGNADGWIYAVAINLDPVVGRLAADQAVRPSQAARPTASSQRAQKPRKR